MEENFIVRQMTPEDLTQVAQVIDLSFGRVFRFFASHSVKEEEGQTLVYEEQKAIIGFAKLIEFDVGGYKYGCLLWIAVHPKHRRKGVARALTREAIKRFEEGGSKAVFASTRSRNSGALRTLGSRGFRRIGFSELWKLFGWRIFGFYRDIWLAPGEVVLIHGL